MKTTKNYLSPVAKTLVFALTLTSIFSSCKKDKDNPTPPVPKPATVSIIHAAPGMPELSFFVDKVNKATKALTYNTAIDYQSINSGKRELSVTKKGITDILVKVEVSLAAEKSYSAFVADKTGNALVIVADDLTAPAADKAKIRFINLSPDAGNIDLAVTGKTEALIAKKAFKEASDFTNTSEVGAEINFEIRENGKTTVLATLPKVKIEKGKIYTIYAKGLKAAADDTKLGLAVLTNK